MNSTEEDAEMLPSKAMFEALFRSEGDAIIFTNVARKIALVNQAMATMFAYKPEELIGKQTAVLYDSPEEYERQGTLRYNLNAKEKLQPYEVMYRRKNGALFWGETVGSIVKDEIGNVIGYKGMIRDITTRKKSEETLHLALEEIGQLKDRLQAENIYLREEIKTEKNFDEIIGKSPNLKKVLHKVEQVAPTDATVLILGETGTGKELIARAIHNLSSRSDRPLVKMNCGAIPQGLLDSELFGHEKGAFTGAIQRRIGRFELADGGTIFLDEIGELPIEAQVRLLRILQEQEFERVGSSQAIKIDVRIIAATNRNLEALSKEGIFRLDLFYRLNVFPLELPPLRERPIDIPPLVNCFLSKFAKKMGRPVPDVSIATLSKLCDYPWPGNIRELENVIERSMILSQGPTMEIDESFEAQINAALPMPTTTNTTLEAVERNHILSVLKETKFVVEGKRGAATILDLNPNTLRFRMKKLRIHRPE